MRRLAVIDVVGLTERHLGPFTPALTRFRQQAQTARVRPAFPAVTCTAQSDYLTGQRPAAHGIVGNGWYDRSLAEVHFWKQSDRLVQAPKLWEALRRAHPQFTCAKLFWWYNMYGAVDYSITPRPIYPADGRKIFDIYTRPAELRTAAQADLGPFPFATFWGPAAGVQSPQGKPAAASQWIADSAKWVECRHQPTLNLIYLPHLDYNLQRLGPNHPAIGDDLRRVDDVVGGLIDFFRGREVEVVVLSEYGIVPVQRPVHLNRLFRAKGWLTLKDELGRETLDAGASRVFVVADHQIAHVYVNDPSLLNAARTLLESEAGVAQVLDAKAQGERGLRHHRAGDLVAVAEADAWFTYYFWEDDAKAPDYARTVDIHRKPGYDPVELFLDPNQRLVQGRILWRLAQKRLGFRMLMDVIPLDATLVRGSHGAQPADPQDWPVLLASRHGLWSGDVLESTDVHAVLRRSVLD